MPQKSRGGKLFIQGAAIQGDEWLVGSLAFLMYHPGDMLFPRTALSQNHHSYLDGSKHIHQFYYLREGFTGPGKDLLTTLGNMFIPFPQGVQKFKQLSLHLTLREIIGCALLDGCHGRGITLIVRHDDKLVLITILPHPFQQLDAITIGQP